ncbi:hypothetical protein C2857_005423 [Epichloe festucae Fl1]|uniref:Uncharacterized protein n=1 Tax=Epichloe festucae (strain Fl1) TaxID=877507 RepID=A0A7S9PVW9_EPIFF|nr:hypothetical protein C2857_005423 [Epichloe festucae Fl1]
MPANWSGSSGLAGHGVLRSHELNHGGLRMPRASVLFFTRNRKNMPTSFAADLVGSAFPRDARFGPLVNLLPLRTDRHCPSCSSIPRSASPTKSRPRLANLPCGVPKSRTTPVESVQSVPSLPPEDGFHIRPNEARGIFNGNNGGWSRWDLYLCCYSSAVINTESKGDMHTIVVEQYSAFSEQSRLAGICRVQEMASSRHLPDSHFLFLFFLFFFSRKEKRTNAVFGNIPWKRSSLLTPSLESTTGSFIEHGAAERPVNDWKFPLRIDT